MGISMMTALAIQGGPVRVSVGGPAKDNGKFVGWILKEDDRFSPLLNTEAIYDTPEEARAEMERLIKEIRETDLLGGSKSANTE